MIARTWREDCSSYNVMHYYILNKATERQPNGLEAILWAVLVVE